MRETRPSGSVRGVRSDPYPYRDILQPLRSSVFQPNLDPDLSGTPAARLKHLRKPEPGYP